MVCEKPGPFKTVSKQKQIKLRFIGASETSCPQPRLPEFSLETGASSGGLVPQLVSRRSSAEAHRLSHDTGHLCQNFLNFVFPSRDNSLEEHMSNPTFRRWTADEIAKLKNLAQRHPRAEIAAKLGRSVAATTLKAHELKLSLRMRDQSDQVQR